MPRALNPNDNEPALDCAAVDGLIASLLPVVPAIAVRFGIPAEFKSGLLDDELHAISRAAERRIHEYTSGRVLGRRAMQALGLPPAAIGREVGRAPRWPAHSIGSITHAHGLAATAIARAGTLAGLGIDLELANRVDAPLYPKLFTERELAGLGVVGTVDAGTTRQATLCFSAKEAVYKAVNPRVGRFIGFHEVEVTLEAANDEGPVSADARTTAQTTESGTFHMCYVGDHAPNRIMEQGSGIYCFFGRYVFTLFMIA